MSKRSVSVSESDEHIVETRCEESVQKDGVTVPLLFGLPLMQ